MMMATVPKIQKDTPVGLATMPETDAKNWVVVEERENEFVIEILD